MTEVHLRELSVSFSFHGDLKRNGGARRLNHDSASFRSSYGPSLRPDDTRPPPAAYLSLYRCKTRQAGTRGKHIVRANRLFSTSHSDFGRLKSLFLFLAGSFALLLFRARTVLPLIGSQFSFSRWYV